MKCILFIAAAVVATASGCASTSATTTAPSTAAAAAVPAESAGPSSYFDDQYDTRKIAQINAIARSRGVDVKWINYPQRKPSSLPALPPTGT